MTRARTYYKATRPDSTSFYDGTTHWEVGKITRLPAGSELPYLSVSTSPTDCTGFRWPARLFEVRPVRGHAVSTPDAESLPNKRGADAWRVVRELPAHELFGPHGEQVVALIDRVSRLTANEATALAAAWDSAWNAAWDSAWNAAAEVVWDATRDAAWDSAWNAAAEVVRDAAQDAAWVAAYDATAEVVRAAKVATRDAALAFIVRDLISEEHFDVLYGPWQTVMEAKS